MILYTNKLFNIQAIYTKHSYIFTLNLFLHICVTCMNTFFIIHLLNNLLKSYGWHWFHAPRVRVTKSVNVLSCCSLSCPHAHITLFCLITVQPESMLVKSSRSRPMGVNVWYKLLGYHYARIITVLFPEAQLNLFSVKQNVNKVTLKNAEFLNGKNTRTKSKVIPACVKANLLIYCVASNESLDLVLSNRAVSWSPLWIGFFCR